MDLANDIAHGLVKQLPEVDDLRGLIVNQYEEFKNQYRNGAKSIPPIPGAGKPVNGVLDVNGLLKYLYVASESEVNLPRLFERWTISTVDDRIIYDNELIRYLNEHGRYKNLVTLESAKEYASHTVDDRDGGKRKKPREFYVNLPEYEDDKKPKPRIAASRPNDRPPPNDFMVESSNLAEPSDPTVYLTPEAVEVRRQVKEIENDLLAIRTDGAWYGRGGKHDIPRDACFIGHYGDCYVWVGPDGMRDLSILTIKSLKFASLVKDESILTVPGPRFTPASGFPAP
jgi:hypothetical protein